MYTDLKLTFSRNTGFIQKVLFKPLGIANRSVIAKLTTDNLATKLQEIAILSYRNIKNKIPQYVK